MATLGPSAPSFGFEDLLGELEADPGFQRERSNEEVAFSLGSIPALPEPTHSETSVYPTDTEATPGDLSPLAAEALDEFEAELPQILAAHDQMMSERRKREEEIEDGYAMLADALQQGAYPGAARMVSELMMSSVDQAKARIVNTLTQVTPLMRVTPIASSAFAAEVASQMAASTERFLDSYLRHELRVEDTLNLAGLRLTKVGTCVLRVDWAKEPVEGFFYDEMGQAAMEGGEHGRVRVEPIRNSDMILWPCWKQDWQRDYEIVGHRASLTVTGWRSLAASVGISTEDILDVEAFSSGGSTENSEGNSFGDMPQAKREGIDAEPMTQVRGQQIIVVTELWCRRSLGPNDPPTKFRVYYHEGLKRILWAGMNPLFSRKHPYFPIRYKIADNSGWGNGIGQETYMSQFADTAFRNLEIDTLMSTAFPVTLLKAGSAADAIMDRPYPGIRIATEEPDGDMEIKSLAEAGKSALELLYQAVNANEARKMSATGLASVLQGQGDPTMKSGAGTGAVMALIEQAGKKFGDVDATVRRDWSHVCEFVLDLVFQYAPDGLFYEYADPQSAETLIQAKYAPPRGGLVSKFFRITAEAPSASNNKEMQKNHLTMTYNFMQQHVQMLLPLAQQIYQASNPAGFIPFLYQLVAFINDLAKKLVEANDLPSVSDKMPMVEPPTPLEQQMNQLIQQMQGLMQQNQQLQAALGAASPSAQPGMGAVGAVGAPAGPPPAPPGGARR